MATVFMKWLERSPRQYERGIHLLTLGRLKQLQARIAERYIKPGMRVLELGCGTGALSRAMARKGAQVTAIDVSAAMLAEASKQVAAEDLEDLVVFDHMDATLIADHFDPGSFDLIVASLFFSELPGDERSQVLAGVKQLLAAEGCLVVVDEVIPDGFGAKLAYRIIRTPISILTWLLTRATTKAIDNANQMFNGSGFRHDQVASHILGSLILYEATAIAPQEGSVEPTMSEIEILRHGVSLRSLLLDLWAVFLRIIPPYPKVHPGLYAIGKPGDDSPVLVSGNFDLTVRRLVRELDGKQDVWLLIGDSKGINVWCAAGGGYFTADAVIAALRSSPLEQRVKHRKLILPQLCANGVDGWQIRRETGWEVAWGPVRAEDIPLYLSVGEKTGDMRMVHFPLKDRLEMVTVTLGFYGLLILLPILLFWRSLFWPVTFSLLGLSYFYAVAMPWLPGRDGLLKSISLGLISLAGLCIYVFTVERLPPPSLFNWTLGLIGLSVFTAAEMQGMSPLMRGEQANWAWELVIAAVLLLAYWLVPLVVGWG